ncbi:hypothetical protein GCM10009808_06870 [Microbacterium sediminicola]|uniref:Uncharacterized protein n=1 Tax=Microbacterium sediminicola TaxID=415210 RepID=A0ABN2HRV3_9MICO
MTETLIDALTAWWGPGLGPDGISAISKAPPEHWLAFAEHLESQHHLGSSRPVNLQAYCATNSRPDELYSPDLLPLAGARVRALALLVGEVAVLDPLHPLLMSIRASQADSWTEPPSSSELASVLGTIVELAPLERLGAVRYFRPPSSADFAEHTVSAWQAMNEIAEDQLDWRWMTDPKGVRGDASKTLAAMEVVHSIAIARQVAPNGAIHIGTPLERSVIERLVETQGTGGENRRAMRDFSVLPIPVLIPDSSTVAVARQSDAYVGFRQELTRAMQIVHAIPNSDESWLATAREVMSDELESASRVLSKQVNKAGFLSTIRRAGRTFGFAGLGAAGGQLMGGNLVAASASAAISGVAAALTEYLLMRPSSISQRAVLETYSMFGPARD